MHGKSLQGMDAQRGYHIRISTGRSDHIKALPFETRTSSEGVQTEGSNRDDRILIHLYKVQEAAFVGKVLMESDVHNLKHI